MKNLHLCISLILFLSPTSVFAQFFERSLQPIIHNYTLNLNAIRSDSTLYWQTEYNNLSFRTFQMHRVDYDGNITTTTVFRSGVPTFLKILPFSDGYIVVDQYFQCDFKSKLTMTWVDLQGSKKWSVILDESIKNYALLPGDDQSFWLFRDGKSAQRISYKNAAILEETGSPMPVFDFFKQMPNGRWLTLNEHGIYLIPSSFAFVQAINIKNILKIEPLSNGKYVALKENELLLLNDDFSTLKSVALDTKANNTADLASDDQYLWLLQGESPPIKFLRFTYDLTLSETIVIPKDAAFQPLAIHAMPGRLVLAGNERSGGQVAAIRSTPTLEPYFDTKPDAALLEVNSKSEALIFYSKPPIGDVIYSFQLKGLEVKIQNRGKSILDKVNVMAYLGTTSFGCSSTKTYLETFKGLNLIPGDSIVLQLPNIHVETQSFSGPFPIYEQCFLITLPNDSLDANAENNRACAQIKTIINTHNLSANNPCIITPNPVHDIAQVSWPGSGGATLQIIDLNGRILAQKYVTDNQLTLPAEQWLPGLYQVLVRTDEGQLFYGKLIKM